MLKNKYKCFLLLLIVAIVILTTGTSMAADYSCKVDLLGNKTEIKAGESVTILVKVSNIQAGEGIASFNTMLEYDSNVFSCVVSGDDAGTWQKQGLVENSLSMTRADLVANSSDQTIAKIVLTAKADATVGTQTFKLTKMEFSTGEETFSVSDVAATITIKDESGSGNSGDNDNNDNNDNNDDDNNNNNNNNNNTGNNTSQKPSNGAGTSGGNTGTTGGNSSSGNSKINKNTGTIANVASSDNVIPKTGVTDVLIISAIIGAIAAIVFYIKYKRAY